MTNATSVRPKAAAAILGVSTVTIWRWARSIPGFPRPRRLSARCTVFDRDQLIRWRDAHAVGAPSPEAPAASWRDRIRAGGAA